MIKVLLKVILVARDLRHQSFLGENIVHLVFWELYHALTGQYSVYSSESSQSLDLAELTPQSRTISIPDEVYCQVKILHGP